MRRIPSIAGSLLGLLALGVLVVALALTFGGLPREAKPASQAFQSPIETPTQPPYPPPATPTRPPVPTIPPTVTRAPKPSPSPTPIPTATPVPTPLPLPPSAFYALWAENYPEGQGSVLWLADPRDIGSRREVLRFEQEHIVHAALSPNGRRLALVTFFHKGMTLWVANVEGSNLRQVGLVDSPGGAVRNYPLWARDSGALVYIKDRPISLTEVRREFRLVDVDSGEDRLLVRDNVERLSSPLGWSANGQWLYYLRSVVGKGNELWAVDRVGEDPHSVLDLGQRGVSELSPDGRRLLIGTESGLGWISIESHEQQVVWRPGQGFTAVWSADGQALVISQWGTKTQSPIIRVDIHSRVTRQAGVIPTRAWRFLALSDDGQWLAAYLYQTGLYWIHLPTSTVVPIPGQDGWTKFVGWVPRHLIGR